MSTWYNKSALVIKCICFNNFLCVFWPVNNWAISGVRKNQTNYLNYQWDKSFHLLKWKHESLLANLQYLSISTWTFYTHFDLIMYKCTPTILQINWDERLGLKLHNIINCNPQPSAHNKRDAGQRAFSLPQWWNILSHHIVAKTTSVGTYYSVYITWQGRTK